MGSLSSSSSWRIRRPACGERRASSGSKLSRCQEEKVGTGSGKQGGKEVRVILEGAKVFQVPKCCPLRGFDWSWKVRIKDIMCKQITKESCSHCFSAISTLTGAAALAAGKQS